ncbi:hypothetical protein BDN70DRAFT_413271 [Pholiota conissans]|uniref:Uncharacterized protein n=1 Tax=Pholiota conissans TaxID=109636 RepID=A0A9P5YPI1_9AGAR|nr:hypothetical protein BDN70DRAFT_413271 [Pholiota conissans]
MLFNTLLSRPTRHFSAGRRNFEQRPIALANRRCYSTSHDGTSRAYNVEEYLEAPVVHSQIMAASIVLDAPVEVFRIEPQTRKSSVRDMYLFFGFRHSI